ncbi:MAG: DUF58 domain-containing protein [Oscillospiraceae bacterium]|nr:DUF58 domain-containing protein [Oscillospiraceae bacterium]
MKTKGNRAKSSSLMVSDPALGLLALGLAVALWRKAVLMAGLCLFFLLLGVVCRVWCDRATKGLRLHMECPRTRLFPGQETTISYEVTNDKLLPLVWMELSQNGPERDCLIPDDAFERYQVPYEDRERPVHFLRQSFSYIGSFQTVRIDSRWKAERRGLYVIDKLVARSGDGFGLAQKEHTLSSKDVPMIAVYPRPVDVDLSLFLRPRWDANVGNRGWMEDNTVLRGNREYQPGDNWKHINWRMAAREQGTPINLYETIQPGAVRFILDGESFCGFEEELEDVLEILAALLTGLSGAGLACSLALPDSLHFPAMTVRSDGMGSVDELLLRIAGYECLCEREPDTEEIVYLPSAFPTDAASRTRVNYLLTRNGGVLPKRLMVRIPEGKCTVLCLENAEAAHRVGLPAVSLHSLKKGGGAK